MILENGERREYIFCFVQNPREDAQTQGIKPTGQQEEGEQNRSLGTLQAAS